MVSISKLALNYNTCLNLSREHSRAMLRPQFARSQVSDLKLEEEHVQLLLVAIDSMKGASTGTVDLRPLFFNLTLDSATQFLFGESVYSQRLERPVAQKGALDIDWSSFAEHFDNANAVTIIRSRLMELYWICNPKSFQRDCHQVHKLVDYFVDRELRGEKSGSDSHGYVFSRELAKIMKDRVELRSQLLNILLAGRDTTAGLLGFTFYFLARHPRVYEKLRQSILEDFGTGTDKISFESLKACTYLQHVMNEVLRLEPNVPENARRAVRNTTLPRGGGPDGASPIYIRAGTEVLYYCRIMHRREDLWGEDAHVFKPERWQKKRPGWEYLPFNGGPRICLGQQFALTEAGYVIVRMVQKYDRIENLDDKPQKHRLTQTTSPVEVLVRLHEASD
jgi:cytochrome P450